MFFNMKYSRFSMSIMIAFVVIAELFTLNINAINATPQLPSGLDVAFKFRSIRGETPGELVALKYGKNADIDRATDPEDIWNGGGVYTGQPTGAAEIMEISSTDTNDTSAGTGARTIEICNILDSTGALVDNITVTLNGTSWVDIHASNLYYRAGTTMNIKTAGSVGHNIGEIILRHKTTTANIFAVMPATNNQTAIGAYTVPLGKTLYIDDLEAHLSRTSGAAGSAIMRFMSREYGTDTVFNTMVNPTITSENGYSNPHTWYMFPERTDLKWNCYSVSDDNTIITCEFNGILSNN